MAQPSIFIGSSSEGLEVARAIQYQLRKEARVTVWNEGVFDLSQNYLQSLIDSLDNFDHAILVFTADDTVISRDETSPATRGNVLFELGLFMGKLGRSRTFVVYDTHKRPNVISDLSGVTFAPYDGSNSEDLLSAVGPACFDIRRALVGAMQEDISERPKIQKIDNPSILCASSIQYEAQGFEQDINIIKAAFPQCLVEHQVNSSRLQALLTGNRFDIVHILGFIHPKTGECVLSELEELSEEFYTKIKFGKIVLENVDSIKAEGFANFIKETKARLVVLAMCDSLLLAVHLARVTNVIASTDWAKIQDIVKWEESFYSLLAQGRSLSDAFDLAKAATAAPMILLMRSDISFAR
jgi:hypothetical protein